MSTDVAADTQAHQLVVFTLGAEEYGVPIKLVQEIIRYTEPRPIPGSPHGVEGVINLRGRIIPVVDLRSRFGTMGERAEDAKIVIVELPDTTVGVIVDEVKEVLTVDADQCEDPPEGAGNADYLESVAKLEGRLLVILNMSVLFGAQSLSY
ncbi:MAG: chemotaxis protein CheW [Actinobacteria bacterium]|nr:chemotaxis protein CheW [Thermoleophilia bacterium]MCB9012081.1 chemotaxis protein CheW [Actinomycetota bacterium]